MKKICFMIFFLFLCIGMISCLIEDEASNDINDTISIEDPNYGYYQNNNLWKNKEVTVCWENPSANNVTERQWVRQAVEESWNAYSGINLVGWDKCSYQAANIIIKINDEQPHTKGLGSVIDALDDGMVLNFTFSNWCPNCADNREFSIKSIAIHEFGHALGLAHEHNRDDRDYDCTDEPQGDNGNRTVGPFDRESIMNYCYNSSYNGELSYWDIKTIRQMYGYAAPARPTMYVMKGTPIGLTQENNYIGHYTTSHIFNLGLVPSEYGNINKDTVAYSIENVGGQPLILTGSQAVRILSQTSGAHFSFLTLPTDMTIAPEERLVFSIQYENNSISSQSARLEITSNDSRLSNFQIRLTGQAVKGTTVPLYRYYGNGDHFYTINNNTAIKKFLSQIGYNYEGIECYTFPVKSGDSVPLYRFYGNGDHFYTINKSAIPTVIANGWKYEGIECYIFSSKKNNTVPLYRFYGSGDHFYTINGSVISYLTSYGWKYEGIEGYVFPSNMNF